MAKFEIKMPKLGESITEGTIVSWSVQVGDTIQEDDTLFEVNTAKVNAEIPSPVSGKLSEIFFKEGDTVAVGVTVAIVDTGDTGEEKPVSASENVQTPPPASGEKTVTKETETEVKAESDRWYSPVVLQKAQEAGISKDELDRIAGTGFSGRVSKKDIELYIDQKKKGNTQQQAETGKEKTVPQSTATQATEKETPVLQIPYSGEDEIIEMDAVRRIIADRMVQSKKISAHVTTIMEVDVTRLAHWREQHKEAFLKREGIPLTFMPAITEAAGKALQDFPRINSSVDGHRIIQKKHIHIGIAVSLNDGNLIVPVIKDADKLSLSGIALSIEALAKKARQNKLTLDDIQGGTFTITNYGSFQNIIATPIINQPEVAILGVGSVQKKPAVVQTTEGDMIAIRHKMYLSLSYDHRIIDGALGGMFLKRVADYLENWDQ